MTWRWWGIFFFAFCFMEFMAWFLHKYVMHGFLWILHEDHHLPVAGRNYQRNDAFAVVFAVPSFLMILFDSLFDLPQLGAFGFGVMFYGIAYFFVHEMVIHRRWRFIKIGKNWYFEAVNAAHKIHHSKLTKAGCENFGMLIVPWDYFANSLRRRAKVQAGDG